MSFTIFYNGKSPFQVIKRRSSKSRTIDIIPKRLTHGFGQKMAFFSNFFFWTNIGQENVFYDFLERKKAFQSYKNKKFKSQKIDIKKSINGYFSKVVNQWFWSKNGHFSNFFFLVHLGQEMFFKRFWKGKSPFQAIETRTSKIRNIDIFQKGLTQGLVQK